MKKQLYIWLLWAVMLCGCYRDKEIEPVLLQTEEQLVSFPDSARTILESWYPGKQFDSFNRAYYFLLLSQARYDNGELIFESDSIISAAMKRFRHSKRTDLYARACLWKGRIWNKLDKPSAAIDVFMLGINALKKNGNHTEILSKLYDELGNTYLYQELYTDALAIYRQEFELDSMVNNYRGLSFSLRNIGGAYHFMGIEDTTGVYTDSALYYYKEALRYARLSEDPVYMSDVIYNDISIWYEWSGEYAQALHYADSIRQPTDKIKLNKASIFIGLDQLDSAIYLLNGLAISDDMGVRTLYNSQFSRIEQKKENYKAALDYYKIFKAQIDSIYSKRQTAELKAVDHLHNIEKATAEVKKRYTGWIGVIILFVVIVSAVVYVMWILRKKRRELEEMVRERNLLNLQNSLLQKEKRIEELIGQIAALNRQTENEDSNRNDDAKLKTMKKEHEKELLAARKEMRDIVFGNNPVYALMTEIEKSGKGKLNTEQQETIKKEIERTLPGYIGRIKQEYPSAKENDTIIYWLLETGFNSKTVGLFYNLSDTAIRSRMKRMKQDKP